MRMQATVQSRQVRVFDRFELARSARTELISAGWPPQDIRIFDSRAAALTRYLDGPPISEAIAGFITGAVLTTILAVVPQLRPIFDGGGLPMVAVVLFGALVGGIGSFLIARANPPMVIERDLGEDEYVLVAEGPMERRAA
jgi:hypothetical protein